MSTYKNIAAVGAGGIGGPITKALISEGVTPLVVTRPGSTATPPEGAKVVAIEYSDVSALAAAFSEHKTEVVISTIAHAALPHQSLLADAAKQAGVQLFLPSEFGYSTVGLAHVEGELGLKSRLGEYLAKIGLPSLRIFNGGFITYIPWLTEAGSGTFKIIGPGDKKGSFTYPSDIAGFTAYVVTHLSPSQLANKIFRIEGEHATLSEIAAYYGSKVTVEHVDEFAGDEFKTVLQNVIASGRGSVAYDAVAGKELTSSDAAGSANAFWVGHQWIGIKEGLGL